MRIGRDLTWVEEHALARKFLRENSYEILVDEFYRGLDRIDFIAFDEPKNAIVFVELQCPRQPYVLENPRNDFDKKKFEHLTLAFLYKYPCLATLDIRADRLVLLRDDDGHVIMHHFSNVASIVFK